MLLCVERKYPQNRESHDRDPDITFEGLASREGVNPLQSSKIVVVTPEGYKTATRSVDSTANIVPIFLGFRERDAYCKNSS